MSAELLAAYAVLWKVVTNLRSISLFCLTKVIDTVELWRLPNKRKTSLRFLAAYLLKADIQVSVMCCNIAISY